MYFIPVASICYLNTCATIDSSLDFNNFKRKVYSDTHTLNLIIISVLNNNHHGDLLSYLGKNFEGFQILHLKSSLSM